MKASFLYGFNLYLLCTISHNEWICFLKSVTPYAIESLNSGLRKVTKGKGSFINENALMKVLFLRIQDLQKNWSKSIKNWGTVQNELSILFEDRFLKYIGI